MRMNNINVPERLEGSKTQLTHLKYASVDLETTGLDPEDSQILQFGITLDDLKSPVENLPQLEVVVLARDGLYCGGSFALNMNRNIMEMIADIESALEDGTTVITRDYCYADELPDVVSQFLHFHGWTGDKVTFAGKNFSNFDKAFLEKINFFKTIPMSHRVIDVGSMYWEPAIDGGELPNMKTCLGRAGLRSVVNHTALADSLDVVNLIRAKHKVGRVIYASAESKIETRDTAESDLE